MRMGKYDTEGNVIMDANRLYKEDGPKGLNGNLYVQEYGQGLEEVSPMQMFFLVLSISACVILNLEDVALPVTYSVGQHSRDDFSCLNNVAILPNLPT